MRLGDVSRACLEYLKHSVSGWGKSMKIDVAAIIETVHADPERQIETWLGSLIDVTRPALDCGLGQIAFIYDAADPFQIRIQAFARRDTPEGAEQALAQLEHKFDGNFVEQAFWMHPCSTASQIPYWDKLREMRSDLAKHGIFDGLSVNGINADRTGVIITAFRNREGNV